MNTSFVVVSIWATWRWNGISGTAPYIAREGASGSELLSIFVQWLWFLWQQDILFVADPKALQYIFNSSGYRFTKIIDSRFITDAAVGQGVGTVDGMRMGSVLPMFFVWWKLQVASTNDSGRFSVLLLLHPSCDSFWTSSRHLLWRYGSTPASTTLAHLNALAYRED